jgi:hypothetical protein
MHNLTVTNVQTPEGEEIEMASSAQPVEHPEWNLADQRTPDEIRTAMNREQLARLAATRKETAKPWWRVW